MTISRLLRLVLAGLIITAAPAAAQEYPSHQVTFVVPFAPGGGTDIIGRLIGQKLSDRFGKSFVIENRPGAGTLTAAVQVSKACPMVTHHDGDQRHHGDEPDALQGAADAPGKDLVLAGLICRSAVRAGGQQRPAGQIGRRSGQAREGAAAELRLGGVGAFHHLLGELFNSQFGTKMAHVPYRGTLPALNDLIAGHIQVLFADLAPAYPQIQAGKVRALGVSDDTARGLGAGADAARRGRHTRSSTGRPGRRWRCRAASRRRSAPSSTARFMPRSPSRTCRSNWSVCSSSRSARARPAELDRFVATETRRWAKVLQQAGVAGTQ